MINPLRHAFEDDWEVQVPLDFSRFLRFLISDVRRYHEHPRSLFLHLDSTPKLLQSPCGILHLLHKVSTFLNSRFSGSKEIPQKCKINDVELQNCKIPSNPPQRREEICGCIGGNAARVPRSGGGCHVFWACARSFQILCATQPRP